MFEQVCFENGPTEILMQASVSQPPGIGWDVGEGQGWERGILEDPSWKGWVPKTVPQSKSLIGRECNHWKVITPESD